MIFNLASFTVFWCQFGILKRQSFSEGSRENFRKISHFSLNCSADLMTQNLNFRISKLISEHLVILLLKDFNIANLALASWIGRLGQRCSFVLICLIFWLSWNRMQIWYLQFSRAISASWSHFFTTRLLWHLLVFTHFKALIWRTSLSFRSSTSYSSNSKNPYFFQTLHSQINNRFLIMTFHFAKPYLRSGSNIMLLAGSVSAIYARSWQTSLWATAMTLLVVIWIRSVEFSANYSTFIARSFSTASRSLWNSNSLL